MLANIKFFAHARNETYDMTNGIFREKFDSPRLYILLNFNFIFLKERVFVSVNNTLFYSGTKSIQIRIHKVS
jgi:hypothetical protein